MRTKLNLLLGLVGAALFIQGHNGFLEAQEWGGASPGAWTSCREFMVPKKLVNGKSVGQEECRMLETKFRHQARKYRRVDMGISGTVEGYAVKEGAMAEYFTDGPEFVFPHFGQGPWVHGMARYESSAGLGMIVLHPEVGTGWNGKLWIHIHGGGFCARGEGSKSTVDPSDPLKDISKYNKLMLEKGYAVAISTRAPSEITRRGTVAYTERQAGSCSAVALDDGTTLIDLNFTDHAGLHLGFVKLVKRFLKGRLGQEPSRTYWYGHSSGARVGRLVNYKEGFNVDESGKPMVDGFLGDDSATGLWLPVLFQDGKDVLFTTDKDRERFVKQIDLTHQSYVNWVNNPLPEWVSRVYIVNKRRGAKLLREKGLGNKHRMYEVRGVSHSGGDYLRDGKKGDVEVLDLSRLMDAQIDLLDRWVEKGIEPPPTKSDWLELGDANGDGMNENEALALPEVACPLGVYYPYPPSLGVRGVGSTGFAAFDGQSLEPLDGRGVFVDMNLNGYPDVRESVNQAWRRLGLLKPGEAFTRDKYVDCVKASVAKLRKERFITEKVTTFYLEQAAQGELPKQ